MLPRAPFLLLLAVSFCCALAPAALAQGSSSRMPGQGIQAAMSHEVAPSHEVRIVPSKMPPNSNSSESGAGYWKAEGFDLKSLVAMVYDVDPRRIDFPDGHAADARYDVSLQLAEADSEQSEEAMRQMVQKALAEKLGLAITPEHRAMDVYVLTAPNGPGPALHPHDTFAGVGGAGAVQMEGVGEALDGIQQISYSGRVCPDLATGGLTVSAGTIAEFSSTIEPGLDRLLVNETRLTGNFDFAIAGYSSREELFRQLREQLGLVVTPTQRNVTVLTVRPSSKRSL